MREELVRTEMLLGEEAMKKLAAARVAVFGLGGVGGSVVEALARSGVGAIDVVDNDRICASNLNRQILATTKTIGMLKTDAAEARVKDISPNCKVTKHNVFFLPSDDGGIDFSVFDYVVDAIDTVSGKIALIKRGQAAGVPVISAMGAGNKLDPTAFRVADVYSTSVCPLAKVMRRELKKAGVKSLKVVYSNEEPKKPHGAPQPDAPRKDVPGSVAFVPPVMGSIIAAEVVKDISGVR